MYPEAMANSKVVFVIDELGRGGASEVLVHLVAELRFLGFETLIIVLFGSKDEEEPCQALCSNPTHFHLYLQRPWEIATKFEKIVWILRFIRASITTPKRILKRMQPLSSIPVFNSHSIYGNIFLILPRMLFRQHYLISRHSGLSQRQELGLLRVLEELASKLADVQVVFNETLAQDLVIADKFEYSKINVIPYFIAPPNNCINDISIEEKTDRISLIHIGNLKEVKNQSLIFNACRFILDRGVNFHLTILGDGPLEKLLKKQTEDLGIAEKVTFEGQVSDVWKYLFKSDIFLLSSNREGSNLSVRQAIFAKVPVLATNVGDNAATVGSAGIIVPARGQEAFSNALFSLCTDNILRSKCKNEAQAINIPIYEAEIASYAKLYLQAFNKVRTFVGNEINNI